MRISRGRFRIHLLTGIVTMLAASVLLGLNLQSRETTGYVFTLDSSSSPSKTALRVGTYSIVNYGWPHATLACSEVDSRVKIVVPSDSTELKRVPICMNECDPSESITGEKLSRVAPMIFQLVQKENPFGTPGMVFFTDAIIRYLAVAGLLLLAFTALVEICVRRYLAPAPTLVAEVRPST